MAHHHPGAGREGIAVCPCHPRPCENGRIIVIVPKANYIAVRGKGDPNDEGGAYQQAIGILYAVAYTLKMSYKTDHRIKGFYDYVVSKDFTTM